MHFAKPIIEGGYGYSGIFEVCQKQVDRLEINELLGMSYGNYGPEETTVFSILLQLFLEHPYQFFYRQAAKIQFHWMA